MLYVKIVPLKGLKVNEKTLQKVPKIRTFSLDIIRQSEYN